MTDQDSVAFYFAGIGVVAAKFGIGIRQISIGDQYGLNGIVDLESLPTWCNEAENEGPRYSIQVEDYATTLLAGLAANFILELDRRCQLKQTFGKAGLEMKFLREVWQCLQREPDRAVGIICGSLGSYDDGYVEATTRRLWHRAVRILQQPLHHRQLYRLANELRRNISLSGEEARRQIARE